MIETPGGHFVVPLKHITAPKHILDKQYLENLVVDEFDSIMIILMVESEDEEALQVVHDEVVCAQIMAKNLGFIF